MRVKLKIDLSDVFNVTLLSIALSIVFTALLFKQTINSSSIILISIISFVTVFIIRLVTNKVDYEYLIKFKNRIYSNNTQDDTE